MNKYRDFDNYLKEYPTEDGYFGRYGGNYLNDPDLIQAFKEYAEGYNTIASLPSLSMSCAASAGISRDARHLFTTARTYPIFLAGLKST